MPAKTIAKGLREFVELTQVKQWSDGQLVRSFVAGREEAAFAELVRRHGPMVLRVCRQLLGHLQDAEDAFQAVFLVLSRKAPRIQPPEAIGSWLYGVAYRISLKTKSLLNHRQTHEKQVSAMPESSQRPRASSVDAEVVLKEIERLPEKYRLPVVLCELEGGSRREVARELGLPEGTLSSRLATARRRLGQRLARRGLDCSAGSLALVQAGSAGAVPPELATAAVKASTLPLAQAAALGTVSANATALAKGMLAKFLWAKIIKTTAGLTVLVFLALGATTYPAIGKTESGPVLKPSPSAPVEEPTLTPLTPQAPENKDVAKVLQDWREAFLPKKHDFGAAARGSVLRHSLPLVNKAKATLEIKNVRVSCGCVTAKASQNVLRPNQTGSLDLVLDTGRFSGAKTMVVFVHVDIQGEVHEFRVVLTAVSLE